MAAKNGRLDASSLEKALEAALNDQPEEPARKDPAEEVMCHGYENTGGIDANLAAKLHDKLACQPDAQEPTEETGLRAPACTRMLTAAELADLDDEEDVEDAEGTHKVHIDKSNHGCIDNIDSRLVTELNKKLNDEVAHIAHDVSHPPAGPSGPGIDSGSLGAALAGLAKMEDSEAKGPGVNHDALSAALEAKLTGQAGGEGLTAAIERRFSACEMPTADMLSGAPIVQEAAGDYTTDADEEEVPASSGLRAPQCTVKLSAAALAELSDDDEVVDSALLVAQNQGNIGAADINSDLVAQLQKQLGGGGQEDDQKDYSLGCRAPMNTTKLTGAMLPPDSDEDEPVLDTKKHGNIDAVDASFCSALQSKLERAEVDEDVEATEHVERGCRAPHATVKLDPAMLDMLEDDIEEAEHDPAKVGAAAAAMLCNMTADGGGFPSPPNPFGQGLPDDRIEDDEDDRGPCVSAGLRAPEPTKLITADMLVGLDDDDDIPCAPDPASFMPMEASPSDSKSSSKPKKGVGFSVSMAIEQEPRDEDELTKSGMRAPATTQVISASMLTDLDDDDPMADHPMGSLGGPSADQLATLAAAALSLSDSGLVNGAQQQQNGFTTGGVSMNGTSTAKAIQNARGLQEGTDMWGQPRPMQSACKLRLAWLSKDEVRKENNQLRQEIASLRAEIDMHRKEATLARKG